MRLRKQLGMVICVVLSLALIIQLAGCGTIIYPERRGQTSGRIDIGIAILDAVGLFFFIIPGVIAFGVDFTTGAIYLPGGHHRSSVHSDGEDMTVIHVNPREIDAKMLEEIVKKHTGCSTSLCLSNAEVHVLDSSEMIATKLSEARTSGYRVY